MSKVKPWLFQSSWYYILFQSSWYQTLFQNSDTVPELRYCSRLVDVRHWAKILGLLLLLLLQRSLPRSVAIVYCTRSSKFFLLYWCNTNWHFLASYNNFSFQFMSFRDSFLNTKFVGWYCFDITLILLCYCFNISHWLRIFFYQIQLGIFKRNFNPNTYLSFSS